jgi:hypothetical protein
MVPEIAGKALGRKGLLYGKLVGEWHQIAGPDLGQATAPVKLVFPRGERSDATLTLDVVPARAVEVQHALPQLIERVNAVFGYRAVVRVKLVQRLPAVRGPKLVNLRPLSPSEESELTAMTALIPDGELRAALDRLGRAVRAGSK